MKLLIATHNPGKVREYREIFHDLPVKIVSLDEEGITMEPEETGKTFKDNAVLKARAFAGAGGLLTLADDSGLEIDALGGEPGVYSARYGGTGKDEHVRRYEIVLSKLKEVPWEKRTARFRCVVAIATPSGMIKTADGIVEGMISRDPKGSNGFGYDPIFFIPELNQTMAEISPEMKHKISHRGNAARTSIPIIKEMRCKM